jgi:hypothetical protein
MKTASSISGSRSFLGTVSLFHDALHFLITALCFRHSQTLLSSTPKIAAALQSPFSSVHRKLNVSTLLYMKVFQISDAIRPTP